MSPAKRKSASKARRPSGARARSRRASAPLAASGKKTPAARKGHRAAVSGGKSGATGASRASTASCDMPREHLERLLDRDAGRVDVLAHVPACHPCTTSLVVLAAQRDSMRHLAAEPGGTAVEFLLERGKRAGERRLADLVYELAKACLVVVKDIDRRVHLETRPREQAAIGRDVRGVERRLNGGAAKGVASRLPLSKPDEANALVAAESCIEILEQVEGGSERQRLAKAVWLICSGRPDLAEQLLAEVLAGASTNDIRRHAFHNLQWALIRQQKHAACVTACERAQSEFPDDLVSTYNLAVAGARLGDSKVLKRAANQLRKGEGDRGTSEFGRDLLAFEVPRFASRLGVSIDEVCQLFGVGRASVRTLHAAR